MSTQRFPRLAIPLVAAVAAAAAPLALASSHREAPFVTEFPKVDSTDFYMFRSYEPGREGFVTIIANYIPFQTEYGGPNFFTMDPDALYQIHIDNNADAREDLTFSFQFTSTLRALTVPVGGKDIPVPLINIGPIGPNPADIGAQNVVESYSIDLIKGTRVGRPFTVSNFDTGSKTFAKPVDNIGGKSIPDYEAFARKHIYSIRIPGCDTPGRVFVGQRKDPFVVNLGEVFDLVNTNPLGPVNAEENVLDEDNVTSIILELPISCLVPGTDPVIGAWTTASLPAVRILRTNPSFDNPAREIGRPIQVSRLSMPLVNELVIGLPDKDRFSAAEPRNDAQFLTYVTNPSFPALLQILFGVQAPCTPRNDLVAVFLTGVDGLNKPANVRPAEMMRLNTAIAAKPRGMQNELGVIAGDTAGYPNGRRPGDDVVDITLRAAMGVLITDPACAPAGPLPLTDGAFVNDQAFGNQFPYLNSPATGSPN